MISAENVTVRFGDHIVLDGKDFAAPAGAISGIYGRSGTGKTTLLRVLAGLLRPDAGTVRFDGGAAAPAGTIAMLDQHPRLVCNPRWTLTRIITEPGDITGRPVDPVSFAERTGLDRDLLSRYPSQVSDGQLQRACLARALVQQPRYLMCDEPTAMLDPIASADVVTMLRSVAAAGTGIVLVSHDPDSIDELCSTTTELR
ncbi:ABC transporter ATP-binding protein [Gordonia rubripertincta]|uniref:ATP-binding cassette domain-containing protein n=1 Tax=Gordonia rubripertincta TaxID=36822 RepID=A0ABT4MX01_GORRU|nr:ATP-binding cassette domain-containing protein [Gordonia rubripertincta]MCZ4551540.1 ATP-binding cassette domain-containing protein [Gordonia rubripertincta]